MYGVWKLLLTVMRLLMKNLTWIDTDKSEQREFEKTRRLKAQVAEKRGEGNWHTPVRATRKKPRYKDKRHYESNLF